MKFYNICIIFAAPGFRYKNINLFTDVANTTSIPIEVEDEGGGEL